MRERQPEREREGERDSLCKQWNDQTERWIDGHLESDGLSDEQTEKDRVMDSETERERERPWAKDKWQKDRERQMDRQRQMDEQTERKMAKTKIGIKKGRLSESRHLFTLENIALELSLHYVWLPRSENLPREILNA